MIRVQFRRSELHNKTNARIVDTNRMVEEELKRQERLRALAASVPYHDTVKNIRSNVHKTTRARMNDYYEPSSDSTLADFQQGMSKLRSFTDEKVFSDPKFRKFSFSLFQLQISSWSLGCIHNFSNRFLRTCASAS